MNSVEDKMAPMRIRVVAISLTIAFGFVEASCSTHRSAKENVPGTISSSRRMPDGKQWMTENLNVNADQSYCYDDTELNCRRYGRLYIRGNQRSGDVDHWETDGDYQRTTNGGNWRSSMVERMTVRMTAVKRRTRRS